LSASEANVGAVLKQERAATLTQFLVTRLIMQGGEEADGTLVSQDVKKTHEFAVQAARCRHNQREKGLVVVTEVIWTVFIALRFRHSRVNEHLVRIGVARLTVTCRVDNVAMKFMNKCNIDDEVCRPSNVQALNLQVPASLAAAGRNAAAAVGTKARGVCDVSDGR
jgi:hypothetical protein